MYIPQFHLDKLKNLSSKKVTIIYGPRRVGKTTLIEKFLEDQKDYLFVTGEDVMIQKLLSCLSVEKLKNFIGDKKLLVIDEAQCVPQIGMNLKLMVDHIEDVRIIATGSSTFDLAKQVGEPLTGRQHIIRMFPISQIELNQIEDPIQREALLESRMIFGSYPEIIVYRNTEDRKEYLRELVSSYLFKDILAYDGIKKSRKMFDLLTLIAFQVGKEVSHSELATKLSMNKGTIERYLDLLEQVFVLVNIRGFSRNLRKEVTKMSRYYFYDNGIRNALINNFNTFNFRDDIGMLWENYIVMERLKKQHFHAIYSNNYFWRTYDQKELDWIEEREGKLYGYEFKWSDIKAKPPKLWFESYPNAFYECINKENYFRFIS